MGGLGGTGSRPQRPPLWRLVLVPEQARAQLHALHVTVLAEARGQVVGTVSVSAAQHPWRAHRAR